MVAYIMKFMTDMPTSWLSIVNVLFHFQCSEFVRTVLEKCDIDEDVQGFINKSRVENSPPGKSIFKCSTLNVVQLIGVFASVSHC